MNVSFSRQTCAVLTCCNNKEDVKLYSFPTAKYSIKRLEEWIKIVDNPNVTIENAHNFRVCSIHFETKYITRNLRLVKNTKPTLNLGSPSLSFPLYEKDPLQEKDDLHIDTVDGTSNYETLMPVNHNVSFSRQTCAVPSCGNNSEDAKLYVFPISKYSTERLKKWIKIVNNPAVTIENARNFRVCSDHFESLNLKLVKNTEPTLKLGYDNVPVPTAL